MRNRKIADALAIHHRAHGRSGGFEQRRFSSDGHLVLDIPYLHGDFQRNRSPMRTSTPSRL